MATAFISSVIEGYAHYRDAAAEGVIAAGGAPLRVEDRPALDQSARNACLDLVEAADVYVVLIAGHGGWITPSGVPATHEEFRHARQKGKPILVLLEDCDRDETAQRLADEASDYVDGRFRITYSTPEEVSLAVAEGLTELLPRFEKPMRNPTSIHAAATGAFLDRQQTVLRIAIGSEREGELFDPLRLEDPGFVESLHRLGHDSSVGLFNYERKKEVTVARDGVTVTQTPERDPALYSQLVVRPDGLLVVETNVTGRQARSRPSDMIGSMAILESDVSAGADRGLGMLGAVYSEMDPHKRFDRLLVSATLGNVGHRTWYESPPLAGPYPMRMRGSDVTSAFDSPRPVTRPELSERDALRERIVVMLRRGIQLE